MNSSLKDFVREKICFYSPVLGINSFNGLIGLAKEQGVRGVEFLNYGEMTTPDMAAARELGRLAREGGLLIPCFSVGLNLVGEDRKEKIADVKRYAEICSELEIPYLHHTVALKFSKPYDVAGMGRNFALGVEATQEIAEYANRLGVKTVLEDQAFIVNGVQGYSRFREAAKNCFDVLLEMGVETDDMTVCGGGSKSALWRQMLADVYGVSVKTLDGSEGAALGAAILGGCAAGVYASVEEGCARAVRVGSSVSPREEEHGRYMKVYALYNGLYGALKPTFDGLRDASL